MDLRHRIRHLERTRGRPALDPQAERRHLRLGLAWMELCTCPGSRAGEEHAIRIKAAIDRGCTAEELEGLYDQTPEPDGGSPWPGWPWPDQRPWSDPQGVQAAGAPQPGGGR